MAESKKYSKDTYIFRDGDPPDAMYIVRTGLVGVTKTKGASEVILAELKPGSMVGEMALFDRKPRSANVKALQDSEVIALPYENLEKQIETLPVWLKAILKTLNENLREANKKIKTLENPSQSEDERFPPHQVNKLLSLLNFVGHKYGQPAEGGGVSLPAGVLRRYTIQIFQEPTNKMQAMLNALKTLGLFVVEDLGEGKQKIVNLQPEFTFGFVDWYNDWLFKADKDRMEALKEEEVKILNGILLFAKKVPANEKGLSKVSLTDIQNDSMRELGFLLKLDDMNSLIEKKYLPEKFMEEKGLFLSINLAEVDANSKYWGLISGLKKNLR